MAQIPGGKHRETKNSAPEIDVMANAVRASPLHPRKQAECFGTMSEHHHHQASCAE
jgi:hypothetical protein